MYVKENLLDNLVFKFERLGEARLMGYILNTFNVNDMTWTYDKHKCVAIMQHCDIKEATIFNYLKLLSKKKILTKISKGVYLVSSEYIQYGSKKTE